MAVAKRGGAVTVRHRGAGLAMALFAAAFAAGCGSTPTAQLYAGADRLYTRAEFEQHIAEHLREVVNSVDSDDAVRAHAVALVKARALARLARAYEALPGRPRARSLPAPDRHEQTVCYDHDGRRAGSCQDI